MSLKSGMHGSPDALAQQVLERLDAESTELLLDLGREEREALFRRFESLAREALASLDLTPEERQAAEERSLALAWMAFEEPGRFLPAGALYALAADQLPLEGRPADRHERVLLRARLGIVLRQLATDGDREALARCAELGRGTVQLADRLWRLPGLPQEDFFALIYELQTWLGRLWRELGDFRAATEAYSQASRAGRTVDQRVSAAVWMAVAYEKLGDPQRAYEVLMLAEDEACQVEDEVVREHWEVAVRTLRFTLGAKPSPQEERAEASWRLEAFDALEEGYRGALEGDGPPDTAHLPSLLRFLENALGARSEDDAAGRHPLLTQLAYVHMGMGEPDLAAAALRRAEELEPGIEDDGLLVDRELMAARCALHADDPERVLEQLQGLLPRAARAGAERELQSLGFLLEAVAQCTSEVDVSELCGWVRRVLTLYADALAALPGAPARRRAREMHQRDLESALAALLSRADQTGIPEEEAQRLLAAAWSLIMASRNPELQARPSAPASDLGEHLSRLEGAFHAALRDQVLGNTGRGAWIKALEELHELERVHLRAPARLDIEPIPAPDGVGLAFFHFRDLLESRPWVVLGSHDGKLRAGQIQLSQALHAPSRPGNGGDGWRDMSSREPVPAGPAEAMPPLHTILPPGLGLLVLRRPRRFGEKVATCRLEPISEASWRIYPDGPLHGVAFEMLTERQPGFVFGQDRAVSLCLRSRPSAACDRPVGFSRGWLGLGGVPGARPLPRSGPEVETIRDSLVRQGHPAHCLLGAEAHAEALRSLLLSFRPAVLHFATHGLADAEHPEACALLLADCERRPERELLPFRLIRQLDLRDVDLVVLSACSSLIGPTSRSAGMEGLAWAFLEAGAAQVVASRQPVNDKATASLMTKLYRHLQDLPVAAALGRTRGEWLEDGESPEHIDPWSVWT